jgi:hypothetical protein
LQKLLDRYRHSPLLIIFNVFFKLCEFLQLLLLQDFLFCFEIHVFLQGMIPVIELLIVHIFIDKVLFHQVGFLFLRIIALPEVAQLRIYVVLVIIFVLWADFSWTSSCTNSYFCAIVLQVSFIKQTVLWV